MKLELHHLNLCSTNVPAMDKFYRNVLGLQPEAQSVGDARVTAQGYDGKVAFLKTGDIQVHLATKDLDVGYRTKQPVNPLEKGHIAFRTDDIEAVKRRLDENGVRYADYGTWAMAGWYLIFFYDPDGNVIEVHQIME